MAFAPSFEELQGPLVAYCRRSGDAGGTTRAPVQKWKAPRTHLHAEMVRKRRDPKKSPKTAVESALRALQSGDVAAVEELLRRDGEQPVEEEWQRRYCDSARIYWDQFYRERTVNFFKDRHYLREDTCRDKA
eukprot:s2289_g4.t1